MLNLWHDNKLSLKRSTWELYLYHNENHNKENYITLDRHNTSQNSHLLKYKNMYKYQINICFENWTLLGYYVVSSGNFLPTFQDNLSVPSSGVKKMLVLALFGQLQQYITKKTNRPNDCAPYCSDKHNKLIPIFTPNTCTVMQESHLLANSAAEKANLEILVIFSPKLLSSLEAFIFCDWKNTKKPLSTAKVVVSESNIKWTLSTVWQN